jgi:hypothetical protein
MLAVIPIFKYVLPLYPKPYSSELVRLVKFGLLGK